MTDGAVLVGVVALYVAIGVGVLAFLLHDRDFQDEVFQHGPMDQFCYAVFVVMAWPMVVSPWPEE